VNESLLREINQQASTEQAKEAGTLTGEAMVRIRQLILDGELEPNTRINEVQLCETFSLSRTPLRAALQTLAGEGLLIYAPNRGFTVREYKLSDIIDAYEMRCLAEGMAARLAAARGVNETELKKMEHALACGDKLLEGGVAESVQQEGYASVNTLFHGAVHRGAGTQLLADVVAVCRIPQVSARKIMPLTIEEITLRQEMHHKIFRAIICREPERADALMQEHVREVKEKMVLALTMHHKGAAD